MFGFAVSKQIPLHMQCWLFGNRIKFYFFRWLLFKICLFNIFLFDKHLANWQTTNLNINVSKIRIFIVESRIPLKKSINSSNYPRKIFFSVLLIRENSLITICKWNFSKRNFSVRVSLLFFLIFFIRIYALWYFSFCSASRSLHLTPSPLNQKSF